VVALAHLDEHRARLVGAPLLGQPARGEGDEEAACEQTSGCEGLDNEGRAPGEAREDARGAKGKEEADRDPGGGEELWGAADDAPLGRRRELAEVSKRVEMAKVDPIPKP